MMRPHDTHLPSPAAPVPGRFALAHPLAAANDRPPPSLTSVAAAVRDGLPRRARPG